MPPITISTPEVLKRILSDKDKPKEMKGPSQVTIFGYGGLTDPFSVVVSTSKVTSQGDNKVDLKQVVEKTLKVWEKSGAQNIVVKEEQFDTPNGAQGLKTYGKADLPSNKPDSLVKGNYVILAFTTNDVIQEIIITWRDRDVYADQMVERILNSVELIKAKE